MHSLFFCSEEHARSYRVSRRQIDGHYLTLAQSTFSTPLGQGALFEF
jgi:hypothetical protein